MNEERMVNAEDRVVDGVEASPETAAISAKAARKKMRRASRLAAGRCPYCGELPMAGQVRCERCVALQQARDRTRTAREKAEREKARREAGPRRCARCGGEQLSKDGTVKGRPHFRCRECGRRSFGDGLVEAPFYSCPYCKAACKKLGTRVMAGRRVVQRYRCRSCGRNNTNLWPEEGASPGGPFPHLMTFYLDKRAELGLDAYLQSKGMSPAQAIREIFIAAGNKPRGFVSRMPKARRLGHWGEADDSDDWDDGYAISQVVSVAIPAPPLPVIPPGGVGLPDLRPEASRKTASQKGRAHLNPTVMVTWKFSVNLNDAALAGLLSVMEQRGLNHQEAARALCAEFFVEGMLADGA